MTDAEMLVIDRRTSDSEGTCGTGQERYWEIDALRGSAVFMMILYHILFDLEYLGVAHFAVETGVLRLLALATVTVFIFVAGISLTLSRYRHSNATRWAGYSRFALRGLKILGAAILITIITYLFVPDRFIVFGVLHCIGSSIVIGPIFLKFTRLNLVLGLSCILTGCLLRHLNGPYWLLWLGIAPYGFASLDYVPLLPWFGVFLLGIYAGSMLYPEGKRGFTIPARAPCLFRPMLWPGRNSLLIYLIHQPIALGLLGLLFPSAVYRLLFHPQVL